jgi:hypothetical protein
MWAVGLVITVGMSRATFMSATIASSVELSSNFRIK